MSDTKILVLTGMCLACLLFSVYGFISQLCNLCRCCYGPRPAVSPSNSTNPAPIVTDCCPNLSTTTREVIILEDPVVTLMPPSELPPRDFTVPDEYVSTTWVQRMLGKSYASTGKVLTRSVSNSSITEVNVSNNTEVIATTTTASIDPLKDSVVP